jgi:hypothetical protein
MPEVPNANGQSTQTRDALHSANERLVHPAWLRLMRFCSELGHGEIAKLKIQDGLPVIADVTTRKVKFNP